MPGGHEHREGRRLWLVRHGETTGGSSLRYYGSTDIPLSDVGRAQVARLSDHLRACRFAALVHSPLARATESARILLGSFTTTPAAVESEEDLREVDFGALEGLTAVEIEQRFPGFWAEWRAGAKTSYPDGETNDSFRERVGRGVDAALSRHPEGDLCVVAHRGVVKAILVHLVGLEWAHVRPWSLDLGSVTVLVETGGGRWTLERYNLIGS